MPHATPDPAALTFVEGLQATQRAQNLAIRAQRDRDLQRWYDAQRELEQAVELFRQADHLGVRAGSLTFARKAWSVAREHVQGALHALQQPSFRLAA